MGKLFSKLLHTMSAFASKSSTNAPAPIKASPSSSKDLNDLPKTMEAPSKKRKLTEDEEELIDSMEFQEVGGRVVHRPLILSLLSSKNPQVIDRIKTKRNNDTEESFNMIKPLMEKWVGASQLRTDVKELVSYCLVLESEQKKLKLTQ